MVLCSDAGRPSGEVALHSEMLSYWLAVWKNSVLTLCVCVCVCAPLNICHSFIIQHTCEPTASTSTCWHMRYSSCHMYKMWTPALVCTHNTFLPPILEELDLLQGWLPGCVAQISGPWLGCDGRESCLVIWELRGSCRPPSSPKKLTLYGESVCQARRLMLLCALDDTIMTNYNEQQGSCLIGWDILTADSLKCSVLTSLQFYWSQNTVWWSCAEDVPGFMAGCWQLHFGLKMWFFLFLLIILLQSQIAWSWKLFVVRYENLYLMTKLWRN